LYFSSNAQYCGASGSLICTPDTSVLKSPGFYPTTQEAPPFINDSTYSATIQLKNFDSVPGGLMDSLQINTITNLPAGLCWATNKSNNTFYHLENGCILLSGTVCDTPGQYLLSITATVNGYGPIPLKYNTPPVLYFLRVNNTGDTPTPVDTTQTASFKQYGTEVCSTGAGISQVETAFSSLTIVPNPISNTATVTFYSTTSGKMTEKITNIIGEQVHMAEREIKTGSNTPFTIQRNNLAPGVYFYTLTDGVNMITKRIVFAD